MNHLLHLLSSLAFILLFGTTFGHAGNTIPPDSTTGIVDKSAAIIMIEEGRGLFGEGKVKDALIRFREASNKDLNSYKAVYWISACHYSLNSYGYALKYAKKAYAMNPEKITREIYVVLGESYHRLGIVDSAIMNYNLALEKLSKSRSRVLLIQHHIDECNFVIEQSKKEVKDIKSRLAGDVNSGYDDYGALIRDNGKTLYFTSRRSNTTGGGMNPDDQLYFEDIYKVVWDGEMKEWSDVTNKIPRLNSDGFDALNVISDDGLTGVITLNSTATDAETVTRGSDLCEIKLNKKGEWNRPRAIKNKSINTSYFDGAATVTADGSTMYFVSDRKGEKSSTDILTHLPQESTKTTSRLKLPNNHSIGLRIILVPRCGTMDTFLQRRIIQHHSEHLIQRRLSMKRLQRSQIHWIASGKLRSSSDIDKKIRLITEVISTIITKEN